MNHAVVIVSRGVITSLVVLKEPLIFVKLQRLQLKLPNGIGTNMTSSKGQIIFPEENKKILNQINK
jgi:hypothetical protein